MKYLLDTNVISELNKENCNPNVRDFMEKISCIDTYLSVITIGEICYGIEKLSAGKKKHNLSIWLYSELSEGYKKRIISLDKEIAITWGKIRIQAGRTLPFSDLIIAATAITHNMFLVTGNPADFDGIEGINMINPWEF